MRASIGIILPLFSVLVLHDLKGNAQNILQNDTTICIGSSIVLSIDTSQLSFAACTANSLLQTLQNSLVAYYPFCGNANDESGNGYHGTTVGATLTTDRFGIPNRAYSLNQGNHIKGSASNFPTAERTVSLWFYPTNIGATSQGPTVIGYGGGVCGKSWFESLDNFFTPQGQQNTYQVQGHCNNESVLYPFGINPNNAWHHWVITTAPTGTKFYIDGALVLTDTTFINETFVQGKDFILGGPVALNGLGFYSDANIYGLEGKLDDVFIYNRALTPAEVLLQFQTQGILWSTGATTKSITVTPAQSTTYYVTVTGPGTSFTDSVRINVAGVTTSVNIAASSTTICAGTPVSFTATPTNGGPAPVYQWKLNGVNTGTNASSYTLTSPANADVVTVSMTSSAICPSPATAVSPPITMSVSSPVTPLLTITASATTICAGSVVTFTANSINGGNSPVYQWKLNGINVGTNSPVFSYNNFTSGDIINCSLTSNAVCATITTVTSNNISILLDPVLCITGFHMPTAFTPNNDGKNDWCKPILVGNVISYKFSIYNRWGQKIFETSDRLKGWNGKLLGLDTDSNIFVWVCTFQFSGQAEETRKGTVVLIH